MAYRPYYRDPVSGSMVPLLGGFSESQANSRYINLSGDTFTGQATISVDPTLATHAVDKDYVNALVPPGIIASTVSATAPAGWLLCDGASYLQSAYPDLYAIIETWYGGNATNFNVPNLKARTIVGVNTGDNDFVSVGKVGGETYHTLSAGEAANAAGALGWHGGGSRTSFYHASGTFQQISYIGAYANPQYYYTGASNVGGADYNYGGGGAGHENRQYSTILNHIIKT